MTKTSEKNTIEKITNDFESVFSGKFYGVLRWPQLDELWELVKSDSEGWYLYAVGSEAPSEVSNAKDTETFINELDTLLRREHNEDYCGIVYTDDLQEPTYIKIFDPNNIGTSCSIAKNPPLPGWILSLKKPIDLPAAMMQQAHRAKNRKRWWSRLFA